MGEGEIVFRGRVFDVRMVTTNGVQREIVTHPGSVGIVPLLDVDGVAHVVLVRQARIATGEALVEIPAGTREPDEDAATTARRELPEEIGYRCGRLERIGGFFTAPGYSSEFMDIFVASELRPETAEGDEDEDIEIVTLPLGEAVRQARAGELRDGKTVAALLMADAGRQA